LLYRILSAIKENCAVEICSFETVLINSRGIHRIFYRHISSLRAPTEFGGGGTFDDFITSKYEGDSISKLQIVIEKNRMEIMTYKQHFFFNIISKQI